jgi:hypothetical protein
VEEKNPQGSKHSHEYGNEDTTILWRDGWMDGWMELIVNKSTYRD